VAPPSFVTAQNRGSCAVCREPTNQVRFRDGKWCHEACAPDQTGSAIEHQMKAALREAEISDPEAHGLEPGEVSPPLREGSYLRGADHEVQKTLADADQIDPARVCVRDVEVLDEPSLVERLFKAKPKEVRRAGLAVVEAIVDALDRAYYACGRLRLAMAGEKESLEDADRLARWLERRGLLEGLAVRLPAVKGTKFPALLEDCLDLGGELVGEENVAIPDVVDGSVDPKKALRRELARRVRAELRPVAAEVVEGKTARISEDGVYRWVLTRTWDSEKPPMILVGLNPSTADDQKDDQTIRRARHFAKREGFGGLVMLNLYAFRSTDPMALISAADAIGPECDAYLRAWCRREGAIVVCAWGTLTISQRPRAKDVLELIWSTGSKPFCFGTTAGGAPRHPSRLPNDAPLVEYRGEDLGVAPP
jgi:hypothetical protein